jgi:hypothetical protein
MGYLGVPSFLLALFIGASPVTSALPAHPAPAVQQSPATSPPTPAPTALSASPVLTQQSSRTWSTTVFLNTAALCLTQLPTFELVTTDPDHDVPGTPEYGIPGEETFSRTPDCQTQATGKEPVATAVTDVQLTFGPSDELAAAPTAATVVVTPQLPGATSVQITVAVHRRVTSWQYLWIPLLCGVALALLLIAWTMIIGVPGVVPAAQGTMTGGPAHMHLARSLRRPLYAASAWTFGGSWATNITAVSTVIAAVITASGAISEVVPGVELGRFSLLIALAGGITGAAPLVFGALNYRFARVDPTTAGVAVVRLPVGLVAILTGGVRAALLGRWIPRFSHGGQVVTLADKDKVHQRGRTAIIDAGAELTLPDGSTPPFLRSRSRKAVLPDGSDARAVATIVVTAGATIAIPSGDLAAQDNPKTTPGVTLTVPAGTSIELAPDPPTSEPILALPGTNDISVFAGQTMTITEPGTAGLPITVPDGAKISFLGRASMTLPAGASIEAPAGQPSSSVKCSSLRFTSVFAIPHSSQVVAAQMWTMLAAASLTMFGIGAELGLLSVLAASLSTADLTIQWIASAAAAVSAIILVWYGVTSIRALADAMPGDAMSSTDTMSFML